MVELIRPKSSDLPVLKSLYLSCFDEDKSAADVMFNSVLDVRYAYAARLNGKIIAALYLLPCEIALENGTAQAHYLMGAGTKSEYRRQGIMAELIKFALTTAKEQGDCFSILEPASQSLYSYYSALGYKESFHSSLFDYDIQNNCKSPIKTCHLTKSSFDIWQSLRFNICKSIRGSVLWRGGHIAACAVVNSCYGGGALGCEYGYALYTRDDSGVFVDELVCLPEYADSILFSLCSALGVSRLSVRCPSNLKSGRSIRMGMALPLDEEKFPLDFDYNAYLGLSFD